MLWLAEAVTCPVSTLSSWTDEAKPCIFLQALFDSTTTQRGGETEGGPKAHVSLAKTQEKVLVSGSASLHIPWMHVIGLQ